MNYYYLLAIPATIAVTLLFLKLYLKLTCGVCRSKNSMEGKVIVVTGANSGIGYETAKDLARRNGRVILACRDMERGTKAAESIISATGNQNVLVRQLDLSSLESVRKFADVINKSEERLDVLIHNAGVICNQELTEDNLDIQFATNHFGPFLLTYLLLDLMKKTAPSRIIVVSSLLHHFATLDLSNLNFEKYKRYSMFVYNSTKLANLLFALELSKRLKGTDVTVNALHPGVVRTGLARNAQRFHESLLVVLFYPFQKTAVEGAQTSVHLAVADEVRNVTGRYFADCKPAWISPFARNTEKAKKLWELSEMFTGICAK